MLFSLILVCQFPFANYFVYLNVFRVCFDLAQANHIKYLASQFFDEGFANNIGKKIELEWPE